MLLNQEHLNKFKYMLQRKENLVILFVIYTYVYTAEFLCSRTIRFYIFVQQFVSLEDRKYFA